MKRALIFVALAMAKTTVAAASGPVYGPQLEGYSYPFPVRQYRFRSQGMAMEMAFMDVKPASPNGRSVVLLHGKNFCAATWEGSIRALTNAGYRVIAPDQVGWCKSTKPAHYQYTFEQLAGNTRGLLTSLGIGGAIVMGHSTGGMLAVRYGLLYPNVTEMLVLVDPLGLEDWRAKGVPWQSLDHQYRAQLNTSADSIRELDDLPENLLGAAFLYAFARAARIDLLHRTSGCSLFADQKRTGRQRMKLVKPLDYDAISARALGLV